MTRLEVAFLVNGVFREYERYGRIHLECRLHRAAVG